MNRERRAVLRGVAAVTGAVLGGRGADGVLGTRGAGGVASAAQQVDTSLSPGVTLFDLNDDGTYAAKVVAASSEIRDDAHPGAIHVTSEGRATVDFAASIVAPDGEVTLGDLERLTYDYYEGPDNGSEGEAAAPDQTFLVVENAEGRHGMYLTYDAGTPAEQWATFDVLARMQGDTAGTSGWFDYTASGEGRTFDDVFARFGQDARLVRVGVGHGNAVNPATLDLSYGNLVINDSARQFPVSVTKRVSLADPF